MEVVDGGGSYPALLGIGWANDSMAIINFKKRILTFENKYTKAIAPMDPHEGRLYIELVKDEVGRGWEHAYNIFEDYIHPTVDGKLRWCSASSTFCNSDDALENWKNRLHEVYFRKCGLVMQFLHCIATKIIKLMIYEGIPELSIFVK